MASSTAKKSHKLESIKNNLFDHGTDSEIEEYVKSTIDGLYAASLYKAEDCVIYYISKDLYSYYDSSFAYALAAGLSILVIS